MDNIETLLERFIDDRDQLSDEELDALVAAAQGDTSIASALKDQLVIDELLAQRLAFDRHNFVAQVGQRIRDQESESSSITAEDGDVAGEMRHLLDVELSKHQHQARRRQSSHWRIALVLMLLVVFSGGAWWWWQTQLQPLAIVEHVHGAPKLVRGPGVRTLQVGDVLRSDDNFTPARSYAWPATRQLRSCAKILRRGNESTSVGERSLQRLCHNRWGGRWS